MRYLITLTLTLILMGAASSAAARGAAPRPNILYFFVDDMGWGSIGPNGQDERRAKGLPNVRTPNIDRLAAEGVNFTRGYACHVCSPSRSSQQSGFHQGHTFADSNDPNNARKAMRSDDVLMGDALSSSGYTTGYWGKWGYGGSKDMVDPTIDNVQTLPTSHGYQFVLAELHHIRAHTFFQPTLWRAPSAKRDTIGGIELVPNSVSAFANNPRFPEAPAKQGHPGYPATAYCDDAYAFAALEFVRSNARAYRRDGKPFFGLLAVQIPHAPFAEISKLPEWDAAYQADPHFSALPAQAQQWAAMVTRIDAHFGNILAALDDPDNDGDQSDSVAADTLVIFQSDNGGPAGANNKVFDANGGLRGNKGTIQEGGIRVPLVMRWPAVIEAGSNLKAGTDCAQVVDITDLLPTFCELGGAPVPLGIDGVSIAPTLLGKGHQRRREFIIHEASNGQSIIRGKHKLVRAGGRKNKKNSLALYDLETDYAEQHDMAAAEPELVKELEALLLGERVTEPRGFANTYHHWIGGDGEVTSDAANWSDYAYTNAGVTYLADAGSPRVSWIARIESQGGAPALARADSDLEFLGLEIRGSSGGSTQSLVLDEKVKLTGRNEIRLASNSRLQIKGGTVSSLRWIDIQAGAVLCGTGTVDATLYNGGAVSVEPGGALEVRVDYHQIDGARLSVPLTKQGPGQLLVSGRASLAGTLAIAIGAGREFEPEHGASFTILSAGHVTGSFSNTDGQVTDSSGRRFSIGYSDEAVTLTFIE